MASWLVVCERCSRHVKSEGACPFCGAEVASREAPTALDARLPRAALLGLGAAISLSVGACGVAPPYGVPPGDVVVPDAVTQDQGGPAPADGAAPDDSGS